MSEHPRDRFDLVPDVAAEVAYASLLAGKDTLLMTVEADVTVGLMGSIAVATDTLVLENYLIEVLLQNVNG